MRDRSGKLIEKARTAVPEGTFAVGAGLAVAAVTSYVFVIVANKGLSEEQYSAFGAFWAFIFVAGPGLFLPLEQEVGRALAHRRAQGIGGGPLVQQAGAPRRDPHRGDGGHRAGDLTALRRQASSTATGCSSPASRSDSSASTACTRRAARCRATRRFRPYGEMLATDGVVRLVGALVLLAIGVDNAGAYGMCMALSPFVAVVVSLRKREQAPRTRARRAPYSELSNALGWLLAGSVLMQLLGYSSLLGVNLLKSPGDTAGGRRVHVRLLRRPDPTTAVPGGAGHAAPEARRASPAPGATTTSGPG